MKTVTVNKVNFSEIFHYAEKEYGIGWNPCNDLFFKEGVLTYRNVDTIYFDERVLDCFYPQDITKEDFAKLTKEEILEFKGNKLAWCIIGKFMLDNNVDEIEVDNN